MKDKTTSLQQTVATIQDGHTVMVGGFGLPGTPLTLVDALLDAGAADLTIIKNEANEPGIGVSKLIEAGRVRKIILSHLGLNTVAMKMMVDKTLEVEFHPQGILAEKIRCGGAGLLAFLTDIGIDTILRDSRQVVTFQGKEAILEPALRADVALVHAARADRLGNLCYTKAAFNFNPLMAMAANTVIAECADVVEPGDIDPDDVRTPGAFVDHLVELDNLSEDYKVLEHHVTKA